MNFNEELIPGKMIKRYKRFFSDVELDNGEVITAHTPNTGSMKKCWDQGWKCLVSKSDNPKRKLKFTLEMTHNNKTWICVNTNLPNKVVKEGILAGKILELGEIDEVISEVKVGKSRIDLYLPKTEHYIEVKNVTYIDGDTALFPDAVTTRGQKHLEELITLVESGKKASMFYLVSRRDATNFSPAVEIDPEYARLLKLAKSKGVGILCYQTHLSENEISIDHPLKVNI